MSPLILSIDGNIGSGKSSIMRYLEANFANYIASKNNNCKICFLQEPVSTWESICDINGKSIITHFYENNERYSFAFQMMAYISRLSLLKEALNGDYDIIITERSIYTDKNVFAKSLYDCKKMNHIEYQIYLKWFDHFNDFQKIQKVIYLKTDPDICFYRISKRNRDGESNISLNYLQDCHKYHQDMINNIEEKQILIIDCNIDTEQNKNINNIWLDKIKSFIYNYTTNL